MALDLDALTAWLDEIAERLYQARANDVTDLTNACDWAHAQLSAVIIELSGDQPTVTTCTHCGCPVRGGVCTDSSCPMSAKTGR